MKYRTLEKGIREYTREDGSAYYHVRVERRKGFGHRKVIEDKVDVVLGLDLARKRLAEITDQANAWQERDKSTEDKPLPRAARLWGWVSE